MNLDKKEYIHPHRFGDGLKLTEFGPSGDGTMFALAVLLADGNGRGSGDVHSDDPIIGSWAGDRIVVAGDYADKMKFIPDDAKQEDLRRIADDIHGEESDIKDVNLSAYAHYLYKDISQAIYEVIKY